jgi:hypothetical protein
MPDVQTELHVPPMVFKIVPGDSLLRPGFSTAKPGEATEKIK